MEQLLSLGGVFGISSDSKSRALLLLLNLLEEGKQCSPVGRTCNSANSVGRRFGRKLIKNADIGLPPQELWLAGRHVRVDRAQALKLLKLVRFETQVLFEVGFYCFNVYF